MFSKQLVSRVLNSKNSGLLFNRTYHGGHHKKATMNDLPIPQGDWQENYNKKQAKYNAILATGIGMLALALGLAKSTGLIHLNFNPPRSID